MQQKVNRKSEIPREMRFIKGVLTSKNHLKVKTNLKHTIERTNKGKHITFIQNLQVHDPIRALKL